MELLQAVLAGEDPESWSEVEQDVKDLREVHVPLADARKEYRALVGESLMAALEALLAEAKDSGKMTAAAAEWRPKLSKPADRLRLPNKVACLTELLWNL